MALNGSFKYLEKMRTYLGRGLVLALASLSLSGPIKEKDYSPFNSRGEFLNAIKSYSSGFVDSGDWKGLKLRKSDLSNLECVVLGVDELNPLVTHSLEKISKNSEGFDSLHDLEKVGKIYNFLGERFSYDQNPFDKLQFTKENLYLLENQLQVLEDLKNHGLGTQSIDESYKFLRGDCDALSCLFVSHLRGADIESKLVLVQAKEPLEGLENEAHIIVLFNWKLGNESGSNLLDPSFFGKKNFKENLIFSWGYMNEEIYKLNMLE